MYRKINRSCSMGDYTTAIIAMVGIGIVLTAAVVFALMRPSDMPPIDEN